MAPDFCSEDDKPAAPTQAANSSIQVTTGAALNTLVLPKAIQGTGNPADGASFEAEGHQVCRPC